MEGVLRRRRPGLPRLRRRPRHDLQRVGLQQAVQHPAAAPPGPAVRRGRALRGRLAHAARDAPRELAQPRRPPRLLLPRAPRRLLHHGLPVEQARQLRGPPAAQPLPPELQRRGTPRDPPHVPPVRHPHVQGLPLQRPQCHGPYAAGRDVRRPPPALRADSRRHDRRVRRPTRPSSSTTTPPRAGTSSCSATRPALAEAPLRLELDDDGFHRTSRRSAGNTDRPRQGPQCRGGGVRTRDDVLVVEGCMAFPGWTSAAPWTTVWSSSTRPRSKITVPLHPGVPARPVEHPQQPRPVRGLARGIPADLVADGGFGVGDLRLRVHLADGSRHRNVV